MIVCCAINKGEFHRGGVLLRVGMQGDNKVQGVEGWVWVTKQGEVSGGEGVI